MAAIKNVSTRDSCVFIERNNLTPCFKVIFILFLRYSCDPDDYNKMSKIVLTRAKPFGHLCQVKSECNGAYHVHDDDVREENLNFIAREAIADVYPVKRWNDATRSPHAEDYFSYGDDSWSLRFRMPYEDQNHDEYHQQDHQICILPYLSKKYVGR